jgi:hypothetical protein
LAAAGLATTVYYITASDEEKDFVTSFENSATEVINASNENLQKVFGALEGLALTTTTFIVQEHRANPTYPAGFVTLPDTEIHLGRAREETDAYIVGYAPTVHEGQHATWSQYAEENKDWMGPAWETYKVKEELNGQVADDTLVDYDEEASYFSSDIWALVVYDGNGNVVVEHPNTCHDNELDHASADRIEHITETSGVASPIWLKSPP